MTDFGYLPGDVAIHLTVDADFFQELRTQDGSNWPAGTASTIVFNDEAGTVWHATVSGPSIIYDVDRAAVNTLLAVPGRPKVRVTYTDGAGADVVWFLGQVARHG